MIKSKRPRDANQLSKFIVDIATGEAPAPENKDNGKNPATVEAAKKDSTIQLNV